MAPWTLEPGETTESAAVPTSFALEQNYPNPFNPSTSISYHLPEQRTVILTVYNSLGQEITTLVNDVQPAGRYSVQWNGTTQAGAPVSSGVYLYRLNAGSFVEMKKMMFLK